MYEEPEEIALEEPPAEVAEEPEPVEPPKGTWQAGCQVAAATLSPPCPNNSGPSEFLSCFLALFTASQT